MAFKSFLRPRPCLPASDGHISNSATLERLCGAPHNRSVTIAPRRYLDEKTGKWEDASSLRTNDLPSLILGLQAAHDYVNSTPLPGLPADAEELVDPSEADDGEAAT